MSNEEKVRTSGEAPRDAAVAQTLPTVNPTAEKSEPAKPALHPSVYIVYVVASASWWSRRHAPRPWQKTTH